MLYLDHNAATPLDERVREAMEPFLGRFYGNPSSLYRLGRLSRDAVEAAREQVAALAGAIPSQVIFTSGGTEANNLALKGLAHALRGRTVAVGAGEHPSVLEPIRALAGDGVARHVIGVAADGKTDRACLAALPADTALVSLMWANNETGVIQDIPALMPALRDQGLWLHSDGVQAAGKIPLDFAASGLHMLSLSSHKIYGPKGAGALVADRALPLQPLLYGGGQERDLRSGTENVPAIVGFGKAAELARREMEERARHALQLRQSLEAALGAMPDVTVFAAGSPRLPNTVQFSVAGMDGEALVMALDRQGVAVSSGSACAGGAAEPSHVLLSMGVEPDTARGAVRVSFGAGNGADDVERFIAALKKARTAYI
ncbi:cysteine desulfurase family protein [Methylogaea oryzae]|uniref:Cysteine desulfurase IscS n=2 Tax=Methylogaea oryzae TaxID=1295382 RepID=A0A8D4VSZ2_9GAMM|nr:cysteine desulfurase family protein [Methylogaea oryzae]BBL71959.1 cysteine desulfurase IscS [Methylogaea oryzae]